MTSGSNRVGSCAMRSRRTVSSGARCRRRRAVPVRVVGGVRLKAVGCRRARLGEPDESGRRRPEEVPGTEFLLPVNTVVKAIGQRPRTEFLEFIEGLEVDRGVIKVDPATG